MDATEAFANFYIPPHLVKKKLLYFNERNLSCVVLAEDAQVSKSPEQQQQESPRLYAIKRIPGHCFLSETHARNVVRELYIHLSLTHDEENTEHIVPLLDVYLADCTSASLLLSKSAPRVRDIYLVMPYMGGGDLQSFAHKAFVNGQRLSELCIKHVSHQLLLALKSLHDRRLLHRDLSLANVLLRTDPDDFQLFLADFGLSRLKSGGCCCASSSSLSSSSSQFDDPENSTVNGITTIEYRAPELLLRHKKYDERVDIWSVGCIVAELFLLERLFILNENDPRDEPHQLRSLIAILGEPELGVVDELGAGSAPKFVRRVIAECQRSGHLKPQFEYIEQRLGAVGASAEAVSFVKSCLTFDYRKREKVDGLLQHAWFADVYEEEDEEEDEEQQEQQEASAQQEAAGAASSSDSMQYAGNSSSNDKITSSRGVSDGQSCEEPPNQEESIVPERREDGEVIIGSAGGGNTGGHDKQSWLDLPLPPPTDDARSGDEVLMSTQKMNLAELSAFLESLCLSASEYFANHR